MGFDQCFRNLEFMSAITISNYMQENFFIYYLGCNNQISKLDLEQKMQAWKVIPGYIGMALFFFLFLRMGFLASATELLGGIWGSPS